MHYVVIRTNCMKVYSFIWKSFDMQDIVIVGANGITGDIGVKRSDNLSDVRTAIIRDWEEDQYFSNVLFKVDDAVIDGQDEINVSVFDLFSKTITLVSDNIKSDTSPQCKEIVIDDDEVSLFI